jgi:hypothetical protein
MLLLRTLNELLYLLIVFKLNNVSIMQNELHIVIMHN